MIRFFRPVALLFLPFLSLQAQDLPHPALGWNGWEVIPHAEFITGSEWTVNAQEGNSLALVSNDSCLQLSWALGQGSDRWVQAYRHFDPALSLEDADLFALDIHGEGCGDGGDCHRQVTIELKFENGSKQAVYVRRGEEGLLSVDRWVDRLFFLKNSESMQAPADFNWDSITVFSIALRSYPDGVSAGADAGHVSFRNFRADFMEEWRPAAALEPLRVESDTLEEVAANALSFLLGRQTATGLLTTWAEDGSSWLYGQGLALKALVLAGTWTGGEPADATALAAQKLARFLAAHQYEDGSWPRAWDSQNGTIRVPQESDGSIWMGDFPFPLMGLETYLKVCCDAEVMDARNQALGLLLSLLDGDGTLHTVNRLTGARPVVTSTEAHVAAYAALLECDRSEEAASLLQHLEPQVWNDGFRLWDEAYGSDRVVLFANTWMAGALAGRGYEAKSLFALSRVGRLLLTNGPACPWGMDGIGPIATWYEGTLSYINAGGPGSNTLFRNLVPFLNPDGSVPHYNDDIGGNGGIWAEPWASLDGTSWLWFTATRQSPFTPLDIPMTCPTGTGPSGKIPSEEIALYPNPAVSVIRIETSGTFEAGAVLRVLDLSGRLCLVRELPAFQAGADLDVRALSPGLYVLEAAPVGTGKTRHLPFVVGRPGTF
ncbi:MAG: hypothetical protein R2751_07260 [Bacteroidales bacterium]